MIYKYHLRLFHIYKEFGDGIFYVHQVLRLLYEMKVSSTTSSLKHLREKGLIITVYDQEDNRRHYQKVSNKGKKVLEDITEDMIAKYYLTKELE